MSHDDQRPRRRGLRGALDLADKAHTAIAVAVVIVLAVLTGLYWLVRAVFALV